MEGVKERVGASVRTAEDVTMTVKGEMGMETVSAEREENRRALFCPFAATGRAILAIADDLGTLLIFFIVSLFGIFSRKQLRETALQLYYVSVASSGIVVLVGLFAGMVLGLQLFHALVQFGSVNGLGTVVALSLVRELGPVLTAIMVAARAGSGMAAEIGFMRTSEQIDALDAMGIDPVRYLVSPRLAASIIGFPVLTAFFDLAGIIGGYLSGVLLMGANAGSYLYRVQASVMLRDVRGGFIKAIVFAVFVSLICCFEGYFCHMRKESSGAKNEGLATRAAAVVSCTAILVSDCVATFLLM